jgi:hypothetical protein
MMWGDFMLAPGEAPDATNGDSAAHARARRALLRSAPGVVVADWHYANDPRPESYRSLGLWKALGAFPVAASWHRPGNIRGHTLAAVREGAGTLQTTWAGVLSDEVSMAGHLEQFAALIVAGDYAWSGRTDPTDKLGYRAGDVFRRLYFSPPQGVGRHDGRSYTDGTSEPSLKVGPVRFLPTGPLPLHTPLTAEGREAPSERSWSINGPATAVAVALDAAGWMREGDPVAEIVVRRADGAVVRQELAYGLHVRGDGDTRAALAAPSAGGVSAVVVLLGANRAQIDTVTVRATDPIAGVRVRGLTVL